MSKCLFTWKKQSAPKITSKFGVGMYVWDTGYIDAPWWNVKRQRWSVIPNSLLVERSLVVVNSQIQLSNGSDMQNCFDPKIIPDCNQTIAESMYFRAVMQVTLVCLSIKE